MKQTSKPEAPEAVAMSLRVQARTHGLNPHTVQSRIRRKSGWSLERAVSEPFKSGGSPWLSEGHAAGRRKIQALKQSNERLATVAQPARERCTLEDP